MAAPPLPAPLRVSDFYERQRRLAYHVSWLAMTLLLVELSLGSVLEYFGQPRAMATEEGAALFYRCLSRDETDSSRFLLLDPSMKPKGEPLHLVDNAGAVVAEGRDLTVFYGSRASVLTDGRNARSPNLGQTWDVLAAVRGPGRDAVWIFGWADGKVVARRRDGGAWGPEIPIAASGLVDRLTAATDGGRGPLVAWREKDSPRVRTALYDGRAFAAGAEFDLGDATHWDATLVGPRTVLAWIHRDDRSLDAITLRTTCCPGCPSPLDAGRIRFADPVLLLGRKITGISLLPTGDRVGIFVTRPSRIVWSSLPAATLRPEPDGAKFHILEVHALWRNVVGSITPTLLFFCSATLVFLGFSLLRERGRMAASQPAPPEAELSSRTMAYLLDLILLWPVVFAVVGYLDIPADDLTDPRSLWILLVGAAVEFAYHVAMEGGLGWTVGKKILGLRVTELDGGRLTWRGALLRNFVRLVDATLPFGWILGTTCILRTKRCQRPGDILARTLVLRG